MRGSAAVGWAKRRASRRAHLLRSRLTMVGKLRLVVLSQKVARFEFENQLFEKIQDWRARC